MTVLDLLLEHGLALASGASALLLAGSLLVLASRAPLHRQRLGECALLAVAVWLVAAFVPMKRWDLSGSPAPSVFAAVESGDRAEGAALRATNPSEARPVAVPGSVGLSPSAAQASVPGHAPLSDSGANPMPDAEVVTLPAAKDQRASVVAGVEAASPPSAGLDLGALLVGAFLVGAAFAVGYLLLGALALLRVMRAVTPAPEHVRRLARVAASDLGLRGRRVRVVVTSRVVRPFCWGLLRHTVVLPLGLCAPERSASLEHVLRHEMAHVRQGDGRGQLLAALLLPVLYWHPFYWWLRRRVRLAAEVVADDLAARQSAVDAYARGLLALLEQETPRFAPVGALSVFGSPSEFYRRMEMLLSRKKNLTTRLSRSRRLFQVAGTVGLAVLAANAWGVSPAVAQQDPLPVRNQQDPRPSPAALRALRAERDALKQKVLELEILLQAVGGRKMRQEGTTIVVEETAPAVAETQVVVVQRGDTLARLLKRHCGRFDPRMMEQVRVLNPAMDPRRLRIGQKLVLPPPPSSIEKVEEVVEVEETVEDPILQDTEITEHPTLLPSEVPSFENPVLAGNRDAPGRDPYSVPISGSRASSTAVMRDSTLELTMRCIDLTGEVELAERELARIHEAHEQGVVPSDVKDRVEVNLRTAQRKLKVARALIKAEIESCEAEIEMLARQRETMTPAHPRRSQNDLQIRRLVSRLEILKSAL